MGVMQLGVPSNVDIIIQYGRTVHTYSATGNQSFLNVTTVDVANVKSRVQVPARVLHSPAVRGGFMFLSCYPIAAPLVRRQAMVNCDTVMQSKRRLLPPAFDC